MATMLRIMQLFCGTSNLLDNLDPLNPWKKKKVKGRYGSKNIKNEDVDKIDCDDNDNGNTSGKVVKRGFGSGFLGFKKNNADKDKESSKSTKNDNDHDKHTKYLTYEWDKLPKSISNAASTLGYNETNWSNDQWSIAEDKNWNYLSPKEQNAAMVLGWDQHAWDTHYEDVSWEDLHSFVQDAATGLGFTCDMWDDDVWPESLDKWWDDLNDEQKVGLNVLGYRQYNWE